MYIPGLGPGPEVETSRLVPATEGRQAVTELGEPQSEKPCPGLRGGPRSGKTPSEEGVFTLTVTEFVRGYSGREGGDGAGSGGSGERPTCLNECVEGHGT